MFKRLLLGLALLLSAVAPAAAQIGGGVYGGVGGKTLQMVSTVTGALATGTTQIPVDDTIPQNTEGDQYMTLSITPKSATSKLVIDVVAVASQSAVGDNNIAAALFQDTTANALAATYQTAGQNHGRVLVIRYVMTSGTTSATTFKVRIGANAAGTTTFNGAISARYFGGVMPSSIVITEYAP